MELIKEILTELISLPHQGATTDNGRTAAGFIEERLKGFGYSVQVDPFVNIEWPIIKQTVDYGIAVVQEIDREM